MFVTIFFIWNAEHDGKRFIVVQIKSKYRYMYTTMLHFGISSYICLEVSRWVRWIALPLFQKRIRLICVRRFFFPLMMLDESGQILTQFEYTLVRTLSSEPASTVGHQYKYCNHSYEIRHSRSPQYLVNDPIDHVCGGGFLVNKVNDKFKTVIYGANKCKVGTEEVNITYIMSLTEPFRKFVSIVRHRILYFQQVAHPMKTNSSSYIRNVPDGGQTWS